MRCCWSPSSSLSTRSYRTERVIRAALIGSITDTIFVLVACAVFVMALDRLWASFALIYGPVTFAPVLLTWGWLLVWLILFGGSLASHIKVMAIEGRTAAEAERLHVADKITA